MGYHLQTVDVPPLARFALASANWLPDSPIDLRTQSAIGQRIQIDTLIVAYRFMRLAVKRQMICKLATLEHACALPGPGRLSVQSGERGHRGYATSPHSDGRPYERTGDHVHHSMPALDVFQLFGKIFAQLCVDCHVDSGAVLANRRNLLDTFTDERAAVCALAFASALSGSASNSFCGLYRRLCNLVIVGNELQLIHAFGSGSAAEPVCPV